MEHTTHATSTHLKDNVFFVPVPTITSDCGNSDIGEPALNAILDEMEMGNVEKVRQILSEDIRAVDILDARGNTLMHMVMNMFQEEPDKALSMVELLLEFSAYMVHRRNTDGHTAFHYACKFRMTNVMYVLVRSGAKNEGKIMQSILCELRNEEETGCKPKPGCTATDITNLVKAVDKLSTDNAVSNTKTTTLDPNVEKGELLQQASDALTRGDTVGITKLMETNPFLKEGCGDNGATLLHLTVQKVATLVQSKIPYENMQHMFELLLSLGANPDVPDKDGCTALHEAASAGLRKATKSLIEKGANVFITDGDGNTPYALALEMQQFTHENSYVQGCDFGCVKNALDARFSHIFDATLKAVKTEAEDDSHGKEPWHENKRRKLS